MIPYTSEVLFAQYEEYNLAIWPAQIIAFVLGGVLLALVLRSSGSSGKVVGATLTALWVWVAIAYHWLTFAIINFAAPVYAALFGVEALLLLWLFVFRGNVGFRFNRDLAGWASLALMMFGLLLYPFLGTLAGHGWPQAAVFGVTPTPLVLFTLGILLLAEPRVSWTALVIPFLWALSTGAIAWYLVIPEDLSLPVAGLVVLVAAIGKNRHAS